MRKRRTNRAALRDEISVLLRTMAFSQTAVRICASEALAPQEEFLLKVLRAECANREEVRRQRFLREAAFPVFKTLDGFDFASVKLPPAFSKQELCSVDFIAEKKNLILFGPVGTGKTHLATALGVCACAKTVRTKFYTAAELVVRLSEAFTAGTLEKLLKTILHADLLIIDEWGYVPVDRQGAQLLFRVISDSYERRSIILTTNMEFSKWGTIFTDDQMAAAMIDRLAHHGHILLFEGESFRMKHALMRQKGQVKLPTT
ncbi:MAG: IS21-like element helper ATPase IstB [Rectinemataceae bacterium]|nr:IS21-like element helper ATPase IstB [Rectinemataceae bacterium]